MTNQTLITRKELSLLCGLSEKVLRTRMDKLGLESCKVRWETKRFFYVKSKAFSFLRGRGYPV